MAEAVLLGFVPQIVVPGNKAEEAVKFYKAAFGAEELRRVPHAKRKADQETPLILSVELKIGSSSFLVSDRFDNAGEDGTEAVGGGIAFRVEAEDVEAAIKKSAEAGAEVVSEVSEDDGGVVGKIKDPYGVHWVFVASVKKSTEAEA